jgi:hypothetical protein
MTEHKFDSPLCYLRYSAKGAGNYHVIFSIKTGKLTDSTISLDILVLIDIVELCLKVN